MRFTSVTTRDISEAGAFVEADNAAAIPLYRIVHLQLERGARELNGLPERLREGRVLSAVWRVGPTPGVTWNARRLCAALPGRSRRANSGSRAVDGGRQLTFRHVAISG